MRFRLSLFIVVCCLTSPVLCQKQKPTPPKAWIGIAFIDVPTSAIPPVFGHKSPNGAVQIQTVIPGASGEQAGLQPDDYVLAIDSIPLDGRTTLLNAVNSKSIGDIIELKIGRNGKSFFQKMALSPRPADLRAIIKTLIGSQAPELVGKYYANNCGSLKENRGKVIILDFWATWCGPCRMTLPALETLYQKYKTNGLVIIGVSSEPLSTLQQFQQTNNHTYPLFHDISQLTQRKYMAYAYPTLVFVDRYGVIQRVETGAHSKEHIESRVRELLGI